jgi:hypothetical protein
MIVNVVLLPKDTVMVRPENIAEDIAYQASTLSLASFTAARCFQVRAVPLLVTLETELVPNIETTT